MASMNKLRKLFSIEAMRKRFKDNGLVPVRGDYGIRTNFDYAKTNEDLKPIDSYSTGHACLIGSFEHMVAKQQKRELMATNKLNVDKMPVRGILGVTPRQLRLLELGWENMDVGGGYDFDGIPQNKDEVELIEIGRSLGALFCGVGDDWDEPGSDWERQLDKRLSKQGF